MALLVTDHADRVRAHRTDPRHDEDMASYSLVKTIWETAKAPGDWRWEPKEAFHAVAPRQGMPLTTAPSVSAATAAGRRS